MLNVLKRAACLGCCLGVIASGADALAAATVSLRAISKNGAPIDATNSVNVVPNDEITAELKVFGWGSPFFDATGANTGLIRTYQVQIDGLAGAQSSGPGHGTVLPKGWDAPLNRVNPPCPPEWPVANVQHGCVGPNFHPEQGGSINTQRGDYVLFGFNSVNAFSNDSLDFKWGATALESDGQAHTICVGGAAAGFPCKVAAECPGGACQPGVFYGGTFNLKVGATACGDFTFNLKNDLTVTFIGNPLTPPEVFLPLLQGLVLRAPACAGDGRCCHPDGICTIEPQSSCEAAGYTFGGVGTNCTAACPVTIGRCCHPDASCTVGSSASCASSGGTYGGNGSTCTPGVCASPNRIVSSNPPHCAIDARIPFVDGVPANRRGFTSIDLTFERTCGTDEDAPGDFTVLQCPATVNSVIQSVVTNGNVATVTFAQPILIRRWTCVVHTKSGTKACLGYLPADANSDRTSAPVDILTIIDGLNGVLNPPLVAYQCDIDRSTQCNPADILSEIDLLNGATGFPNFNGAQLGACPLMTNTTCP